MLLCAENKSVPLLFFAAPLTPLFRGDEERGGRAGVFLVDRRAEGGKVGVASSTVSTTTMFFNGDDLRADEKMPEICSIP